MNPRKSLLSDVPKGEDLDGLFTIHTEPDSTIRVEFGPKTSPNELRLRWKLDAGESNLASALLFVSVFEDLSPTEIPNPKISLPFGSGNIWEIFNAALIAGSREALLFMLMKKLKASLGEGVAIIRSPDNSPATKAKARRSLEKQFSNALDALERKSERRHHGSNITIDWRCNDGTTIAMPLAWVALQIARELVEMKRALPTKGEVQRTIESRFKDVSGASKSAWRETWRAAGLETLPRAGTWTLPDKKRAKRKSGRSKNP